MMDRAIQTRDLVEKFDDFAAVRGVSSEVHSVRLRRPTLEDVFIKLTGRAIRETEGDAAREHMRQRRQLCQGKWDR